MEGGISLDGGVCLDDELSLDHHDADFRAALRNTSPPQEAATPCEGISYDDGNGRGHGHGNGDGDGDGGAVLSQTTSSVAAADARLIGAALPRDLDTLSISSTSSLPRAASRGRARAAPAPRGRVSSHNDVLQRKPKLIAEGGGGGSGSGGSSGGGGGGGARDVRSRVTALQQRHSSSMRTLSGQQVELKHALTRAESHPPPTTHHPPPTTHHRRSSSSTHSCERRESCRARRMRSRFFVRLPSKRSTSWRRWCRGLASERKKKHSFE